MLPSTEIAAEAAGKILDDLLIRIETDTLDVIGKNNIPTAVIHFDRFRDHVRALAEKVTALQKHVDALSQELIPTLFTNQNVKTITIPGVGRTTVNVRWSASMLNKGDAFDWLRETGNEGLIIETVNAQTLGAFAKERTLEGQPLPTDIFKVSSSPFISITKA